MQNKSTDRVLGAPKGKGAPFSERKLEVFRAAAKLFNSRGFNQTTLDDIAATLNVTKPALYYYSKSKDEILFEVGRIALSDAMDLLEYNSDSQESGANRLEQFFASWTESICEDFGKCLVLTGLENFKPASRTKLKAARRKIHLQVAGLIQAGIDDGSIKPCDPKLMSLALFDLFNGIPAWYKPNGRSSLSEITREYWLTVSSGLCAQPLKQA